MLKRILLFLITNLAVILVLNIVLRLLGIDRITDAQGGLNYTSLLIFAAVVGFAGSLISLLISKWSAKRMVGAQIIQQPANPTEQWLLETVEKQARKAGIGMPEVALYDSPEPNAFATGANRNNALVAVSTGLLNSMDKGAVEAVLAHEVSHIANGDMITLTLIQGVVNTFVIFISRVVGHTVDRVVFKNENGYGPAYWITTIAAELVLGILATIIVMWFSRQREFRADAGAARLENREKMISALQALQRHAGETHLPDQMAAFGISGHIGHGIKALFMSHPPLEQRIAALQNA